MNPSVLIAANPYEGELCKKALAEIGLELDFVDSIAGALQAVADRQPLAVIVADGWYDGDPRELLVEVRSAYETLPILLLTDRGSDIADEAAAIRRGATRLFLRPVDAQALADAVEKLAVEAEHAFEAQQPSMLELEAMSDDDWDNRPSVRALKGPLEAYSGTAAMGGFAVEEQPALPRISTEVLGPPSRPSPAARPPESAPVPPGESLGAPPPSVVLVPREDTSPGVLRADDVLSESAGLRLPTLATQPDFFVQVTDVPLPPRPTPAAAEPEPRAPAPSRGRSKLGRRLDREISEMEKRLFPDASPSQVARDDDRDWANALRDDIDLDALALETMPGIDSLDGPTPVETPSTLRPRNGTNGHEPTPPPDSALVVLASEPALPTSSSQLALVDEGSLADDDLAQLLCRLYAAGFSGRIRFSVGEGEKHLWYDAGVPVFATSTFLNDRLGDQLFREGKLGRAELKRTRELTVDNGRRMAQVLVELGLLKPKELFPALRRNLEEIFYSLFGWDRGNWQLDGEQVNAEDRVRPSLHPWAMVLEGIRRKYSLERLLERVGPPETVLTPTTALERALVDGGLSEAERAVASLFDGERSLADVLLAVQGLPGATLGEPALYALAWGLMVTGALRSDEDAAELPVRAASTLVSGLNDRERRSRSRDDDERAGRHDAIDRQRLYAKQSQIDDCDYFAVLGVDRHASTHEIDRAYHRLRADFQPDRFAPSVRDELAATLADIGDVLDEAHRVLSDEAMRQAYRDHLAD